MAFTSRFGPRYKAAPNLMGFTVKRAMPYGIAAGGLAGVAGFTAIFLLENVPLVQHDILQKIPILGSYWTGRGLPPSDNPF